MLQEDMQWYTLMSFKHFCHECNVYYHKTLDFILHRQTHINYSITKCTHCGHDLEPYRGSDSWNIIGEDDPWVHKND